MRITPIISLLALLVLLSACATPQPPPPPTSTPSAPTTAAIDPTAAPAGGLTPAAIATDEGGPTAVLGEWSYTNYAVPAIFQEPVVALMDVSREIQGNYSERVPRGGQVLGTLTSSMAKPPVSYQVDLPILPGAANVDLDNDGEADPGVLVYQLVVSTNMVGDSYLEQLEQGGFSSVLGDPKTGKLREGDLLVWAPDDAQGFPSSAGADGVFFTEDDPAVGLPAGYTLATLGGDGSVSFDRSRIAHMNVREPAAVASPDFSKQGILESYTSLLDVLAVRYAYTELRTLDWAKIRQEYLPRVEAADAAGDMAAYYGILFDLAQSIRDSHVQVTSLNAEMRVNNLLRVAEAFSSNIGAGVSELSDGRVVVTYLDPRGPAAEAGWTFGTEIVSVDGVPIAERIAGLPLLTAESTDEGVRLQQMRFALSFPDGAQVTVAYRLPGEQEPRSATLTAGEVFGSSPPDGPAREEISFRQLDSGHGYIQWKGFDDPLYKLAVWEKFLATFKDAPGLVIDLRGNGGGNLALMYTMASYLFTAEQPAPYHWLDSYVYDEQAGGLVRELASDYTLSSPKPELTYGGPVVVLVDDESASAAEYMPQFLQRQGRALVVGAHGTDGAGGVVEHVAMPGTISFHFTKGRTVFAGGDEYNLEGKGVTLDVRVPVTEESEQAKLDGGDPVLDAAVVALTEAGAEQAAARLTAATWQWSASADVSGQQTTIDAPASYTLSFGKDGAVAVKADCNQASGTYTLGDGGALTIALGPVTAAECGAGSQSEEFLKLVGAATGYQYDGEQLAILLSQESGAAGLLFAPAK
ncbi:MAG: META domain-containing protein [Chloroflexales bacterium]|nr:META domain-containing protein [Chloroflexales bacterium]